MKTYILDTIEKYKRLSKKLDAKTVICNRSWVVFNDCGEREIYKFKEDGTMQIILSGRITVGKWEYDPNDNTVSLFASEQAMMVHPGMYDDVVMALKVDGTDEISFLIDDNNKDNFAPQSLKELLDYFEAKNILFLKAEEEERKRLELFAIQEAERIEKEKKDKEQAEFNERISEEFRTYLRKVKYKPEIKLECNQHFRILISVLGWLVLISAIMYFVCLTIIPSRTNPSLIVLDIIIVFGGAFCYAMILVDKIQHRNTKEFEELLDSFISEHDNKGLFSQTIINELSRIAQNSYSDRELIKCILKTLIFIY